MINEFLASVATGGATVFQTNTPGVAPAQAAALTQAVAQISQTSPNSNVATAAAGGANTFTPIDLVNAPSQVFMTKGLAPQEDLQFRLDSFLNSERSMKMLFDSHGTNICKTACNGNIQALTVAGQGSNCGDAVTQFCKVLNMGFRYKVSRVTIEDVTPGKTPNFNDISLTIMMSDGYTSKDKKIKINKFRDPKNFDRSFISFTLPPEFDMIDFTTAWKIDQEKGRTYDVTVEFVGRQQA
jgi:hypothetical protein